MYRQQALSYEREEGYIVRVRATMRNYNKAKQLGWRFSYSGEGNLYYFVKKG